MAEYVIGQWYRVPCIFGKWGTTKPQWWPVLGPLHNDTRVIDFPYDHYHVDMRFLAPSRTIPHRLHHPAFSAPLHISSCPPIREQKPALRRLKCHAQWPTYPHSKARWMQPLEDAYECASAKAGICPHQGAPLDGLIPDESGVVTCPLHGLRWHTSTGALVRTTTSGGAHA